MTHKKYEALLFDVGGTLLDVVRDPQEIAVEAISHLGTLSVSDYAAGVRQSVKEWREHGGLPESEDHTETWIHHNRRALEIAKFSGDIEMAAKLMEETFLVDGWEIFPDAHKTLKALRNCGTPMGVVSNWPASLESTLRRAAIDKYFTVIVASATVGYAKPHAQIFRIGAERLGVDPQRILYVGDSVEHDVVGARAAGMDVVLVDRTGAIDSDALRIGSLSDLIDLV